MTASAFRSDFLQVLDQRGFIHQGSDLGALDALMNRESVSAYIGFDATADSLHVGSMMPIMLLYWLQQTGHRPVTLMGGGTSKVGDPSGKDDSRKLLSEHDINNNINGIKRIFNKFLNYTQGKNAALMVNNDDWLSKLAYIPFLRDYGRHFSVNRMLSMDSVKLRLDRDQSLSFLEFNYMILQAYDFSELNRRYDVRLQMGGSDQWGNIIQGVELGRRAHSLELFALTCPLITTASGAKMGKSAAGAIWLEEDRLTAYDYWQFWRNTEDADVERFLKLFTTLPLEEVAKLAALKGSEINEAKKVLATAATAAVHGIAAAAQVAETAALTFEAGQLAEDLPNLAISRSKLSEGYGLLAAFVDAGLCVSTSEVRRQIKGGAVRVNDEVQSDAKRMLTAEDLVSGGLIKLSLGRKRHMLLKT